MRIRRSTANIAATQLYAFLYVQHLMALFHPPNNFYGFTPLHCNVGLHLR